VTVKMGAQCATNIPKWIKSYVVDVRVFTYQGTEYPLYLCSPALVPDLSDFIGYFEDAYLVASTKILNLYLSFVLTHEIREHVILREQDDACLVALQMELRDVLIELGSPCFLTYLAYRTGFFRKLVHYYQTREKTDVQTLLSRLKKSLSFLNELATRLQNGEQVHQALCLTCHKPIMLYDEGNCSHCHA